MGDVDDHVIIDGNNLLHALRESGVIASPGRETLVRHLERWAKDKPASVTVVFDGAPPPGPMARQLSSTTVSVQFSAPATADDVIAAMIARAPDPARHRVISSDNAIRHEARLRRCRDDGADAFIRELFPDPPAQRRTSAGTPEKPGDLSPDDQADWRRTFGGDDDEPFDGYQAMVQ